MTPVSSERAADEEKVQRAFNFKINSESTATPQISIQGTPKKQRALNFYSNTGIFAYPKKGFTVHRITISSSKVSQRKSV